MRPRDLASTEEAVNGFYPTPAKLAEKMLEGIEWGSVYRVLEPSAGKGNIIEVIRDISYDLKYQGQRYHREKVIEIDCVEIDPNLQAILKYTFSEAGDKKLYDEAQELYNRSYKLTPEEADRHTKLQEIIRQHKSVDVRVVHDDIFTFHTYGTYDLCVMNPPFANGDAHLLRVLEIMRNGGKVVCLLNAETIRNPYTISRKILAKRLDELNAEIEFIENAFADAERRTDVEIAIIRITIPKPERRSEFYDRMKKAADERIETDPELKELVTGNYLEQAVQMYRVEVDATLALVREYYALRPYIARKLNGGSAFPIVCLTMGKYNEHDFSLNEYLKAVRGKYWSALLRNPKFIGKLTSDLVEKYHNEVERMADYEFSMFNIMQIYYDMQEAMSRGIEGAILNLFDELTIKHANWPECKNTIHYYDGWRTNKAHKIGPKVILPERVHKWSVYGNEHWVDQQKAYNVLSDIEKTLDYLSAKEISDGYDLHSRLSIANANRRTRNIELKYFNVDFFKKGTMHIKFHADAMDIVQRLNIFGSQHHGWLPPDYGKKHYSKMDAEEKAVVDAFHGDGTTGSGEGKYAEIMAKADYYLSAPDRKLPALMAPGTQ